MNKSMILTLPEELDNKIDASFKETFLSKEQYMRMAFELLNLIVDEKRKNKGCKLWLGKQSDALIHIAVPGILDI